MVNSIQPYENTLSIDELRREVRECWNRERALIKAIQDMVETPSPWTLIFLNRASHWPDDYNLGKLLQRKMGLEVIPPKTECESGAGVWYRIRQGLILPRSETV